MFAVQIAGFAGQLNSIFAGVTGGVLITGFTDIWTASNTFLPAESMAVPALKSAEYLPCGRNQSIQRNISSCKIMRFKFVCI
jgi:hypothetical protein